MFGRSKNRQQAAQAAWDRKTAAAQAEREAGWAREDAEQRAEKWDRVVKRMTARGEDHEGRDLAIRNRDRARDAARDAETRGLGAKYRR